MFHYVHILYHVVQYTVNGEGLRQLYIKFYFILTFLI
jgi:hypothetical protein